MEEVQGKIVCFDDGMRRWLRPGALVLLLLFQASCSPSEGQRELADPHNAEQVARGRALYANHCATCHGTRLEGQPNWRVRKPDGRLPAPPHDVTGHTWEHSDESLFKVTKQGVGPFVSPSYETDMQGFGGVLTDEEIWSVIAYIKSKWPESLRERRRPKKHEAH